MGTSRIPVSTCRLQLNRIFGFREVMLIASYLRKLGISDVYLSPVFRSRPGSTHGYDITDPRTLNPELGSSADFQDMVRELKRLDMGILLDIVPNHLAADAQNPWWMDVLENGPASPWAQLFDIDWQAEVLPRNRLLLPVLGNPALEVINKGEILLKLDGDGLSLHYFENRFPLDVRSYGLVLSHVLDRSGPERVSHARNADPARLLDSIERLPPQGTSELWHAGRYRERQAVKAAFTDLLSGSAEIKDLILHGIEAVNNRGEGDPSLDVLKDLLEQQAYILDFWKTGLPRVNYRRFFDISDLAGVRVENPEFMDATHSLIYDLVREGRVTGLRIDHIDGLRDPLSYLRRLHSILSPGSRPNPQDPPFFLLVEKILTGDEVLPPEWPAHGTTGYDFLNVVNAVFIDPSGLSKLVERYGDVMDMKEGFEEILYRKKKQVMDDLFRSEIKASARRLAHLAALYSPDVTAEDLQQAVIEMTACLPVYRTYIRDFNLSQTDRHYMEQAAGEALRRVPSLDMPIRFLKRVLFMESPLTAPDRCKDVWLDFVMRWQQLTGAVMAKGHEDTALYNYSPLISINEVGGEPVPMHDPLETFHRYNTCQREHRPYSLKATSTHDTKRGEDVRARINVLSEIPDSWQARLSRWMGWNGRRKKLWGNESVPDSDMEMLIYQSMLGAWPFFSSELPEFKDRFKAYVIKAAREAKAYTGWLSINQEYEEALLNFTGAILDLPAADRFMRDFLSLQKEIAYYGVFNSLSQVVLKVASPGVVDLYRGTELWDLSLVDPDNRRPVDFDLRRSMMDEMDGEIDAATLRELMLAPEDGRIKLYAVTKALKTRMEYPDLFLNGDYLPLDASGECRGHIAAFARRFEGWWALAVVPRLLTRLIERGSLPVGERPWAGTGLELPPDAPRCWHNVFTGDSIERDECVRLPLSSVFRSFPVALLLGQKNRRHKGQGEYGRFQPSSQPSPVSAEGEAEIRSLSTATFFRSREKDKPAFGRFQLRPSFAPARRRSECTDLPG